MAAIKVKCLVCGEPMFVASRFGGVPIYWSCGCQKGDGFSINEVEATALAAMQERLAEQAEKIEAMQAVIDDKLWHRRCRECGNEAYHRDTITPHVNCEKCGSQDTRPIRKPKPCTGPQPCGRSGCKRCKGADDAS